MGSGMSGGGSVGGGSVGGTSVGGTGVFVGGTKVFVVTATNAQNTMIGIASTRTVLATKGRSARCRLMRISPCR